MEFPTDNALLKMYAVDQSNIFWVVSVPKFNTSLWNCLLNGGESGLCNGQRRCYALLKGLVCHPQPPRGHGGKMFGSRFRQEVIKSV